MLVVRLLDRVESESRDQRSKIIASLGRYERVLDGLKAVLRLVELKWGYGNEGYCSQVTVAQDTVAQSGHTFFFFSGTGFFV